jgi:mRNA-degrading endonuclease toxin of MazEF toxin-antitoxin module
MSKIVPSRGEIWKANIGEPPASHWVVVVSLDARNHHASIRSILIVPFSGRLREGPTTIVLDSPETGLPKRSCLRAHFIQPLAKLQLIQRLSQKLSDGRMEELCLAIRRSYDPDAPSGNLPT